MKYDKNLCINIAAYVLIIGSGLFVGCWENVMYKLSLIFTELFIVYKIFYWSYMLYCSYCFYKDIKLQSEKERKYVQAEILTCTKLNRRQSSCISRYATAKYMYNNKIIIGKVICSYSEDICKNDMMEVLVFKRNNNIFAFSVQHIKNAILTYVVFIILILPLLIVIALVILKPTI